MDYSLNEASEAGGTTYRLGAFFLRVNIKSNDLSKLGESLKAIRASAEEAQATDVQVEVEVE